MKLLLLLVITSVLHFCGCQYSAITVDGQLSEWESKSGFSVTTNITFYLGWWNGDFAFALKTPNNSVLNQLALYIYFNAQPYETFLNSTGDTGTFSPITTQYGQTSFSFKADLVASWSPTEGSAVFSWDSTSWISIINATQNASTPGIVEGKIFSSDNLTTNGFTSVWVQIANTVNYTSTYLPGANLIFTFPLINGAVASTWNGYVTGFPATTAEDGSLYNTTGKWLGDIDLFSVQNKSFLNTQSSDAPSGVVRSVNVAVCNESGLSTQSGLIYKFGHDDTTYAQFLSYPASLQPADIIFEGAVLEISSAMYIGSPARVIWREFPVYTTPNVFNLHLISETTSGINLIQMDFYNNFNLSIFTLHMYPGVQLSVNILDNGTLGLRYRNDSVLIYENSTLVNSTVRTDEWDYLMPSTPNKVIIASGLTFHANMEDSGLLFADQILVQGTLTLDGITTDGRLVTNNLTIDGGFVHVVSQNMYILDTFMGATENNVKCEPVFYIYVTGQTYTWPEFTFTTRDGFNETQYSSFASSSTINVQSSQLFIYLNAPLEGLSFAIYNITNELYTGTNISIMTSGFYYVKVVHPVSGCQTKTSINVTFANTPSSPSPSVNSVTPVATPSNNPSSKSSLLGLIALIALLPIVMVAFLIIKKRSAGKKREMELEEMSEKLPVDKTPPESNSKSEDRYTQFASKSESAISTAQPKTSVAPESRSESKQSLQRSSSIKMNWEIDFNEINILEELGRGAFGIVYKCKWRNTECVVKQIDKENAIDLSSVLKEANNVKNMRSHPNVCPVFGVCTDPEYPICIVMEYLSDGSLDNLLYEERITITPQRLVEFAKSIASGMSHVHKENILHCDLACRNVLVEQKRIDKYVLKIADFGLSRVVETNEYKASSSSAFPIRWTAPEALRSGKISRASDVWSYGVTLWEIAEAKRPYPELNNAEVLEGVCDRGLRLPRPKRVQVPDELWTLMQRCWMAPPERPSFEVICGVLDEIEEKYFGANAVHLDNPKKGTQQHNAPTSYATMTEYLRNSNTVHTLE